MKVADLIDKEYIKNETVLRAVYKMLEKDAKLDTKSICRYIEENTKSTDEVIEIITTLCQNATQKKSILIEAKRLLPLTESKLILDTIEKHKFEKNDIKEKNNSDWLCEGEISKLHKAGENPQLNAKILEEHLKATNGKIVTRFPPEPNGILHIGHAKAINLNFEYAIKYGGYTYLRFDDTNPKNEELSYFYSIISDVEWLGYKPYKITASSDYFENMIDFGRQLIKKGKAYICELPAEEMKSRRRLYLDNIEKNEKSKEELASLLSPFRNRTIDENLQIYEGMVSKKYREGMYTLRFKMDLVSKNPLMLDLVGMRLLDCEHARTGSKYNLYPTYEFALCVSDSLENVTHSFCTREFFTRQESYNWLLDTLELYKPVQWEFSRLNLSNTVVSKRKLIQLKKYGIELDDPRLYTLKGMRRRGIPASAINKFVRSVGITFADTTIDVKLLDRFVKDELNKTARRIMCVMDPLKVFIRNSKAQTIIASDNCHNGIDRELFFTPNIYIEKSDFSDCSTKDFLRFTPTQPVGLYLFGVIKFIEFEGETIIAELTDETPKKYIHWVECDSVKVQLRLYENLFIDDNLEDSINLNSKSTVTGYCDKRIMGCKVEDKFQFQRIGYFCVDPDSTENNIVLNRTMLLK